MLRWWSGHFCFYPIRQISTLRAAHPSLFNPLVSFCVFLNKIQPNWIITMKKIVGFVLIAFLLAACKKVHTNNSPSSVQTSIVGNWELNKVATFFTMPPVCGIATLSLFPYLQIMTVTDINLIPTIAGSSCFYQTVLRLFPHLVRTSLHRTAVSLYYIPQPALPEWMNRVRLFC